MEFSYALCLCAFILCGMKNVGFMFFFSNIYFKHVVTAIIISLLIIVNLMKWVDRYTMHNQEVEIPDIKGKQIKEVDDFFKKKRLNYRIIDSSSLDEGIAFGSVVETMPPIGTKVKPGRTVFLTLSSHGTSLLTIPDVRNTSQREAKSLLELKGFRFIKSKVISGDYKKNLVIGLETEDGRKLESGSYFSACVPVVMLVCSGSKEVFFQDTLKEM